MTPYYERDGFTIYHGDCLDVLPTLEPFSVDLIVTDPPYGVRWNGVNRSESSTLLPITGDDGTFDVPAALRLALRTLGRNRHAYVFGRFDLAGLPIGGTCELIWDKGTHVATAIEPWSYQHEYITFTSHVDLPSSRKEGRGNGIARIRRGTVLRYPNTRGMGARRHPTEKPVALLRELIESSSKAGDVVLDPFVGVGSTLIAAAIEGRKAIGIEIEERYCEIAAKRLSDGAFALGRGWDLRA